MTKLVWAMAAIILVGLTLPVHACNIQGKWNIFVQAGYPGGDAAYTCNIKIASSGFVTGSCTVFPTNTPQSTTSIGGNLNADSKCRLTGTLTSNNGFPPVTVHDGLIQGKSGTAIGTRGPVLGPYNHVRLMQFMRGN